MTGSVSLGAVCVLWLAGLGWAGPYQAIMASNTHLAILEECMAFHAAMAQRMGDFGRSDYN